MKTIAISIDEPTLERIDRLASAQGSSHKNRSELVRQAVQEFIARTERIAEEVREKEVFRRHRSRLKRQAAALVKEQATL
jgi:metal-responsive CopG/Arc/MetJ family transcriptional regulator